MFEPLVRAWPAIRLSAINTLIVVLLALIFIDAMPFTPELVRSRIEPVMTAVGIRQGPWGLFAPNPDNLNSRLSAEIEYADGTRAHWMSPDWKRQSYWKRFIDSRNCEYLDNSISTALSARQFLKTDAAAEGIEPIREQLRGLADHIARTHEGPHPQAALRRVTISIERAVVANPSVSGWRPMADPTPYGEQELLFEHIYP